MSRLNSKTLTVAGILLVILALLFLATPLLRTAGVTGRTGTGLTRRFNNNGSGNGFFNPGSGSTDQGGTNGSQNNGQGFFLPGQGGTDQGQTTPNTTFPRRTTTGLTSLFRLSFLSGITGTIVYGLLLLVSLGAALGMLMAKNWGRILGIILGVVYLLLALVSFVPTLLLGFAFRVSSPLNIGLTVAHLVLAIAVIVLALIPAKKIMTPTAPETPAVPAA
jgi:hypothetical protein